MYSYGYNIEYTGIMHMSKGDLNLNSTQTVELLGIDNTGGVQVRPIKLYTSIRLIDPNTKQTVETAKIAYSYYDIYRNLKKTIDYDPHKVCLRTNNPMPMSTKARIGDNGIGATMKCSETYSTSIWNLTLYDKNFALLTTTTKTYENLNNTLISTLTIKKKIDKNGIIYNIERKIFQTIDGLTSTGNLFTSHIKAIYYTDGKLSF
jgi:hypothetical protein